MKETRKDVINCQKYIANGIILSYFESGSNPSPEELRANWNSPMYKDLTDEELSEIINKVKKFFK